MWSTGVVILLCILSFVLGEFAIIGILAFVSVSKEGDNGDEREKKG